MRQAASAVRGAELASCLTSVLLRAPQAKNENSTNGQARWPKKSAVFLLNLLKNAESNAEVGVLYCFSPRLLTTSNIARS